MAGEEITGLSQVAELEQRGEDSCRWTRQDLDGDWGQEVRERAPPSWAAGWAMVLLTQSRREGKITGVGRREEASVT